ncbi:DUF3604 domain-containing protein [Hyphomonas sp.]|uniref:DUF3604 domain-containing protein n=1 Tax=Hyphomonas sp. TaxID=87 RepID=UPI00356B017A
MTCLLVACAPKVATVADGSVIDATPVAAADESPSDCGTTPHDGTSLYWGDIHVHTAYSLDAYGFGTMATPADAYRFARGEPFTLGGETMTLSRPLDFVAVTDHAEWLDIMYICTDPIKLHEPYCDRLRQNSTQATGSKVFGDYVIPTITQVKPQVTPVCEDDPDLCMASLNDAWTRVQQQANEANDPCNFTALIGFEWSATPSYSHTHRNVIFRSESVVPFPIDYIRYPEVGKLWSMLDENCKAEDGCDVITVPHNTNMGDGMSFDVESESERDLGFRTRFERLVEVTQQKGSSECLAPFDERLTSDDCNFELFTTQHSRAVPAADFTEAEWEQTRQTYARSLLFRGLQAFDVSGDKKRNPLQLGFVGSTDAHTGVPGFVDEEMWQGSVFSMGDFDRAMTRSQFNPGGIVGIWARENTRSAIFDAMKRREVYGTSGPRIAVRFDSNPNGSPLACDAADVPSSAEVVMGGQFVKAKGAPAFRVMALPDQIPLDKIEIIKGEWKDGKIHESRSQIWTGTSGKGQTCVVWSDPDFDETAPAFWYPRILQEETPRWTEFMCKRKGQCDAHPEAIQKVQERAWGSAIWYLPDHARE